MSKALLRNHVIVRGRGPADTNSRLVWSHLHQVRSASTVSTTIPITPDKHIPATNSINSKHGSTAQQHGKRRAVPLTHGSVKTTVTSGIHGKISGLSLPNAPNGESTICRGGSSPEEFSGTESDRKKSAAFGRIGGVRGYGSSTPAAMGLSNGTGRRLMGSSPTPARVDAVVIGAGQAGLSVGYHLQKSGGLRFVTLDANQEPGGAWRHRWPSLQLFSTRKWSSLPGYPMYANGACEDGYPSTREMAMYMEEYESVMKLNVVRPVTVTGVSRTAMGTFLVETDCLMGGAPAQWECRAVISAAGTHSTPLWPRLPGAETFRGVQIHSSQYRNAEDFRGARVAVVGAGNSGAQILAEVSEPGMASSTLWSTQEVPSFLPENLPGKEIFETVARIRQKQGFVRPEQIPSLSSIVTNPGVQEAAERGIYDNHIPPLTRFTPTGIVWDASTMTDEDGVTRMFPAGEAELDAVIWCTGYRSNTSHLAKLGVVREDSSMTMDGGDMAEVAEERGVFAVGYGNWAGVGSGSIPGATMYAKRAASAVIQHLRGDNALSAASHNAARPAADLFPSATSSGWPSVGRATAVGWPSRGRISVRSAASDPIAPAADSCAPEPGMVSVAA